MSLSVTVAINTGFVKFPIRAKILAFAGKAAKTLRHNEDLSNDEDYGDYSELDVMAIPMEGNVFIGWYDSEGNLVSSEAEYLLEYGTDYTLEARFEGSEPAGTDKTPVMGPVLIIGIAAAVVVVAVIVILLIRMRKKAK